MNTDLTVRINACRTEARRVGLTLQVITGGGYAFFHPDETESDKDILFAHSIREAEAFAAGIRYALR